LVLSDCVVGPSTSTFDQYFKNIKDVEKVSKGSAMEASGCHEEIVEGMVYAVLLFECNFFAEGEGGEWGFKHWRYVYFSP